MFLVQPFSSSIQQQQHIVLAVGICLIVVLIVICGGESKSGKFVVQEVGFFFLVGRFNHFCTWWLNSLYLEPFQINLPSYHI